MNRQVEGESDYVARLERLYQDWWEHDRGRRSMDPYEALDAAWECAHGNVIALQHLCGCDTPRPRPVVLSAPDLMRVLTMERKAA